MHDHVTDNFLFGYKILVCGYWDGNNFIPVDFSLHRERGKGLDTIREKRNLVQRKAKKAEAAYQEHKEKHLGKRKILNSLRKEMTSNPKVVNVLELILLPLVITLFYRTT